MENIDLKVNTYKLGMKPPLPKFRTIKGARTSAQFGVVATIVGDDFIPGLPLAAIIEAACRVFDIKREDLIGPRRARYLAWPRQIVMHIARDKCPQLSLPQIGRLIGGRDHTTIMYGIKAAQIRLEDSESFRNAYAKVVEELGGRR